ncbi:UDP-N-acetylmuramoyl-L-alanine--D-glutamate ligase, partial [Desulfovibrio sp. OttesenSCG-928-M14]|nr:UDP-N-acetylmuramoyl-L-alanine--D-glutamate ligase [Desulfovibrio sp. OttesenSCG-928-M14]
PPLMAEMDLALLHVVEPVIAVTGTSGKTTTVSLIAAMLEAAGKSVFLGGNIGTPLSEYVLDRLSGKAAAEVLVLEMSSFQLQGARNLKAQVAALLNLAPNHLDQHKDMAEYAEAKFGIFAGQGPEDLALVPPELADDYARRGGLARLEIIRPETDFQETRLLGGHNRFNIRAAWLAAREFGVTREQASKAVSAFVPLPHRLEAVGQIGGVVFVNDSKSTTVDSLRAALNSFEEPVLLLAGGRFKGGDLAGLRGLLEKKVKAVALFGASREIFEKAWQGATPLSWDAAMPEALQRLCALAAPGDVTLLSPATSSYDQYTNYMERGDHFRRLVAERAKERGGQL